MNIHLRPHEYVYVAYEDVHERTRASLLCLDLISVCDEIFAQYAYE